MIIPPRTLLVGCCLALSACRIGDQDAVNSGDPAIVARAFLEAARHRDAKRAWTFIANEAQQRYAEATLREVKVSIYTIDRMPPEERLAQQYYSFSRIRYLLRAAPSITQR